MIPGLPCPLTCDMKRIILPLLLLAASVASIAQKIAPEWNVDMGAIFDNREGDTKITDTKTFFQTRLAPEIGLSVDSGRHTLMVGAVWNQPVGTPWREGSLSPTVYYMFRNRAKGGAVRGMLGMFPRSLLVRRMPDFIWNDSSYYTQSNIRGGAVSIVSGKGFAEGVIDWRGMQTETRREAFNIILRGEAGRDGGWIRGGGLLMMNHLALTHHSPEDEHIVDNFLYNAYAYFDLTHKTRLDSLTIRVGALGAVARHREESAWHRPVGAWMEADMVWRRLSLHNTLYVGGKLFPYYSRFGAMLDQGEPYFRSSWYERLTASLTLVKSRNVDLRASLDFNFAKSNFTFYQRILLGVTFGSKPRNPQRVIY